MTNLTEIGRSLFGPMWREDMQLALEINDRTFRRMAQGTHPVPAGIKQHLAELLRAEARRLDAMAAALEGDAPSSPCAPATRGPR